MRIGFDCAKLVKGTSKSIGIYNITKSVVTRLARQLSKEHELVMRITGRISMSMVLSFTAWSLT